MAKKRVRVLIVDDHLMMIDGLKKLLELDENLKVVGHCTNGADAVSASRKLAPDLIIMDISMPDLNGIDAARKILKFNSKIKIIGLTMHVSQNVLRDSMMAGMKGFVLKESAFTDLHAAVMNVMDGKMHVDPSLAGMILNELVSSDTSIPEKKKNVLTGREREIIQMIAEGKTIKEIAYILKISTKTVETHRKNIMDKLNLNNNSNLTRFAIREGITIPWH